MDDENSGSIPGLVYVLFLKGHTWPELLFLYFLIHIVLSLNFQKRKDYWTLGASYIHDKSANITLAAFKPIFVLLALSFITLLSMLYVLILAFFASLIFEYLPYAIPTFKIGQMTITGDGFNALQFDIKKMVFEGTFIGLLVYFFCYSGIRNKGWSE